MKISISIITLFSLVVLFVGCTPRYTLYRTSCINTPMVRKAGDFNISGDMSLIGLWNAQAAVSPINHFVLMGNMMSSSLRSLKNDTSRIHTHNYEYGAGFYQTFNKAHKNTLTLNAMAGYGQGYMFDKYRDSLWEWFSYYVVSRQALSNNYNKRFLQLSFDKRYSNKAVASISLKFSNINSIINANSDPGQLSSIQGGITHLSFNTLELGLSARFMITEYFSAFYQYKLFLPVGRNSLLNYSTEVTSAGSMFGQYFMAWAFGLTFSEQNLKNIIHKHRYPVEEY